MSEPVLRVERLTKRYGGVAVVSDLAFALAPGETLGFLGQNGAGKSTTLKLLCNLVRPTSGEAWLLGEPLLGRRDAAHRRRLGAIIEAPRFYPWLSGRRNLQQVGRLLGCGREAVEAMLGAVGLAERAGQRFDRFSMGMKQRLGLAAVFLHEPALVILDEPTAGLDPVGRQQMHELIRRLRRERGVSVLISSHDLAEVGALCDRALVIDRGRQVLERTLGGAEDLRAVEACFAELAGTAPMPEPAAGEGA